MRYKIEETRVGQRTNYDRLLLEIWTNGVVTPEMALIEASKILRNTLTRSSPIGNPAPRFPDKGPAGHVRRDWLRSH
ncbi:MAG: hypothetical protein Ct9H300mP1_08270 [Planctomycetaceae bacterium]|nr:MAG: hypothetical protein Ct9H300mP1_08270 [Planctomycetaceae bacterium]